MFSILIVEEVKEALTHPYHPHEHAFNNSPVRFRLNWLINSQDNGQIQNRWLLPEKK